MGTRLPVFVYLPVLCIFSAFGLGQQISPRPLITQPLVESQLTTLKGNTHPLARPQFDIGAASPDLPLNRMLLVLKRSPEQEHALRTLLYNQQDKASPRAKRGKASAFSASEPNSIAMRAPILVVPGGTRFQSLAS